MCTSVRWDKVSIPSPTQESPLQLNTGVRAQPTHEYDMDPTIRAEDTEQAARAVQLALAGAWLVL